MALAACDAFPILFSLLIWVKHSWGAKCNKGISDKISTVRVLHKFSLAPLPGFPWAPQSLLEQSDFLVVGVLGKQGVGKSTVMSLLAGTRTGSGK